MPNPVITTKTGYLPVHITIPNVSHLIYTKLSYSTEHDHHIAHQIAHLLPNSTRLGLYHTMVHPYFTYGNLVWASTYPTRLKSLVVLQKRAMRIICRASYQAHTAQLFLDFAILKIEQINEYQDQ